MTDGISTDTISGFAALGLDPRLVETITAAGYTEPSPIQREAIPVLLSGRDLVGIAGTGTGKTAAFALPLLHKLANTPAADRGRPSILILCPTRELAVQVASAVGKYGKAMGVRVVPVYGGAGFGEQVRALQRGVDVVVATPGRALDHLRRGTMPLTGVASVVLDEADEMLDMGFSDDIEAILSETPKTRQTMLFSATMPPRIAAIADKHLSSPARVSVSKPPVAAGDAPQVRQAVYLVGRDHKTAALARVIDFEAPTAAIVFCHTRSETDGLADALAERGYRPETLHGGLSQEQRDRVMKKFRDGKSTLLIATDVAARGLDINHLSHVINFGLPPAAETYVHRIGRVGRAGREGVALTIADPRQQYMLRGIERAVGGRIEIVRVPTGADLKAKRLERTKEALRATVVAGGLDEFRAVIGELAAEFPAADLAAAALAVAARAQGTPADEKDIPIGLPAKRPAGPMPADGRPGRGEPRGERGGERGEPREPRQERSRKVGSGHARLFIACGRLSGMNRRDLIDAIGNEVGMSARDVGPIDVAERFTLLDVPEDLADQVIEGLNGVRFRGTRLSVRRDRDAAGTTGTAV